MNDVLIVGAGPAGASAAAFLAQSGVDVRLIDRESFPRFHVGESLLPCDLALFARLGIDMQAEGFLYKGGAEFFDERTGQRAVFLFNQGLPGTPTHAYQVDRATFDALVLDSARRAGAHVGLGVRASHLEDADGCVRLHTSHGPLEARYVIDATGQDALFAHRAKSLRRIEDFGLAAVFRHYDGLCDAVWEELASEGHGNIRVLMVDDGWVWIIPLRGRRISVGVVTRKRGVDLDLFDRAFAASPMLQRLTHGSSATEPRIVRNFSYRNSKKCGSRWACIGDSALFLDPVFSSGVSLAMLGAERLADVLVTALEKGREADPDLTLAVSEHMDMAYTTFGTLVGAFYQTRLVQHIFFARDPDPALRAGLISTLAGDVWRADNPFQAMLLRSKRRRFDPHAVA